MRDESRIIETAKDVFDIEIEALQLFRDAIDDVFPQVISAIVNCTGKLIITGIGKPGHIARKMSATFASLGTPSFFLHPAEALHGDLGMVEKNDIVIAMSFSGESDEIINILPAIKLKGSFLIGLTGRGESRLAEYCDLVQIIPEIKEADVLGLAPTSSTTCELVFGDALAVACSQVYGFQKEDFGQNHPAGLLGKKLRLRVSDLMKIDSEQAVIKDDALLKDAIIEMSRKALPVVCMITEDGKLSGVITDGDIRRLLEKQADVYQLRVRDVVTRRPSVVKPQSMAVFALNYMREHRFSSLPVVDDDHRLVGTIVHWDILCSGLV